MKILSVKVKIVADESPDLSWLGEYGRSPDSEWSIDREKRGDQERGEYRYWNPGMNHIPLGDPTRWAHVANTDITDAIKAHGNRKQAIRALDLRHIEEDYRRCEAYNRGDWHTVGIYAEAEVQTPSGTLQTIRSAGLFGIESDSDGEYIAGVGWEELLFLSEELRSFGLSQAAIEGALTEAQCEA